jgi:hypothetical protein
MRLKSKHFILTFILELVFIIAPAQIQQTIQVKSMSELQHAALNGRYTQSAHCNTCKSPFKKGATRANILCVDTFHDYYS